MADRIVAEAIWINPERVSGEPCFLRTRLPIARLFEWLSESKSVNEFSDHWDVPKGILLKVLDVADQDLLKHLASGIDASPIPTNTSAKTLATGSKMS